MCERPYFLILTHTKIIKYLEKKLGQAMIKNC